MDGGGRSRASGKRKPSLAESRSDNAIVPPLKRVNLGVSSATVSMADAIFYHDDAAIAAEQRQELEAAILIKSDSDFAFRLQIEEAITASLACSSSSSNFPGASSSSSLKDAECVVEDDDDFLAVLKFQEEELDLMEMKRKDMDCASSEGLKEKADLKRGIHDRKFASEIMSMSETDWINRGDYIEKPYCNSSGSDYLSDECFRLYFKSVIGENVEFQSYGLGIAICDSNDGLIFNLRKPIFSDDLSHDSAELEALIEGLDAALALDLKRVDIRCDDYLTYSYINGNWKPSDEHIAVLVNKVLLHVKKFVHCTIVLVTKKSVKYAYEFARDAIDSSAKSQVKPGRGKEIAVVCAICLENIDRTQMFTVDGCIHKYCIPCLRQHVVVQLSQAKLSKCPHPDCKTALSIDACRKFLPPNLVDLMNQYIKEASIPTGEKIYCPNVRCSALMTATEVAAYTSKYLDTTVSFERICVRCRGRFCVNCREVWHRNLSCSQYKVSTPYLYTEEAKLNQLATNKKWSRCLKCRHMIELRDGCNHIYCRCGFEFCYICRAEWKNKKPTCICPLWDEGKLLYP